MYKKWLATHNPIVTGDIKLVDLADNWLKKVTLNNFVNNGQHELYIYMSLYFINSFMFKYHKLALVI